MKKNKPENENLFLHNELKNDKKKVFPRKTSSNINYQKESNIFNVKLGQLELNNPFNPNNQNNIRAKNNLNLLPIKKNKNKKEHEINTFSLFFNGDNNFVSSKNEVNLITTQYNYGNNQLLIHKVSKDFTSNKLKIKSLKNIPNNPNNTNNANNVNNNIIKNEIEVKLNTHLNIGRNYYKKSKRALILNDLKTKKNMVSEFKNLKEIHGTTYESQSRPQPQKQSLDINYNANLNLIKIASNKLPGLKKTKKNINLIDYLIIPERNKLITPLVKDKSNYIRKKSEILRNKNSKKEEKDDNNTTFGHKVLWKKISLIKESQNCYIYKAFNISNGSIFIVKEYKIKSKESKDIKKLFYNEAKFLKFVSQKNIVDFIGAEVIDNAYFYIYIDFIGGYSLKDYYKKIGFFTKNLLKSFIEQIIYFLDYMKLKGLVYNNFSFSHFMFDLDGTIKVIDFSQVISQRDIIKINFARHSDDVDFIKFKNMILNIVYNEKSNNFKNNEVSSDICNFCNFLESSLYNVSTLSEFKINYFLKDKEETVYMKNSSIN